MTILLVIFTLIIGFLLGRASIKLTYAGELVQTQPEAGRIRYILDLSTDLYKLGEKKRIVLKVVPLQDTLL